MQEHTDLLQIPREARPTYTVGDLVRHVREQVINDSVLLARIDALAEHVNRLEARVAELEGKG